MKRFIYIFLFYLLASVFSLFLLTGCANLVNQKTYTKNDFEKKIKENSEIFNNKLKETEQKSEQKLQETVKKIEDNSREANVNVVGAININNTKRDKDRVDELLGLKLKAATVLLPSPTPEQLIVENEKVKIELDETKTSLEELNKQYNVVTEENVKKRAEVDQLKADFNNLNIQKIRILEEYNKTEKELQEARNEFNQNKLAESNEREKQAKENKELKAKISYGAFGLGAILLILGLWLLKDKVLGGLGFGFIGFGLIVASAPNWVLWVVPGLLIIGVFGKLIYNFYEEKDMNEGHMKAIQRFKDAGKEGIKDLQEFLREEHGKYDEDGVLIEDKGKQKKIDERLINLGIK